MATTQESLRIGDAERERVRDLLQRHAAEGRLTLDELSDRLAEVYAARTAADLDHALRELPRAESRGVPRGGGPFPAFVVVALLIGAWAIAAATTGVSFLWALWPLLFFGLRFGRGRGWGGPVSCGRGPARG